MYAPTRRGIIANRNRDAGQSISINYLQTSREAFNQHTVAINLIIFMATG